MAYKIIRTDAFQRDLDAVISYIVLSLENKTAAISLLDSIEKCYDSLAHLPLMYEACQDTYLKELGYRKAVIDNYIMVHRVDMKTETVNILRLFHGKQHYVKLI